MVKNRESVPKLNDYIPIVDENTINELLLLASRLKGKKIQHISSASVGGGVAEVLHRIVPLMKELGVDIVWDTIEADLDFSNVTKKFHNALQGAPTRIDDDDFDIYLRAAHNYTAKTPIRGDIVFAHDIGPIAVIQNKKRLKNVKWVWRCHMDVSSPDERVWNFVSTFAEGYDASIFSSPKFTHSLSIPQFLICPAIDPLSPKNKDLTDNEISDVLYNYGIKRDKPIISQVSRYASLKDPVGVIDTFKLVKQYIDAQLVLAGNSAADDIEAEAVLKEIRERAKDVADVHILVIPSDNNDIEINGLQRAASIIIQKSIREGFALTVTEALWKEKPVVASAVGGIPLQIKDRYSGMLCYSIEGAALKIRQLLQNGDFARRLAYNGKEHIRRNFLITRLIREQMLLALGLFQEGDVVTL